MYITLDKAKQFLGVSDSENDAMIQAFIDGAAEVIHQKTQQESLLIREVEEIAQRESSGGKIFTVQEIINGKTLKSVEVLNKDGSLALAQVSPDLSWSIRQSHFRIPFPFSDNFYLRVKYDTGFFTEDKIPQSIQNLVMSIVRSAYIEYSADKKAIEVSGEVAEVVASAITPKIIKTKKTGNTSITYDTSSESIAAAVETATTSSSAFDLYNPKDMGTILLSYTKKSSIRLRTI